MLLRDKLVTNVVIRATECFNLQCNNVARQVEEKCRPYYRTFNLSLYTVKIHQENECAKFEHYFLISNIQVRPLNVRMLYRLWWQ